MSTKYLEVDSTYRNRNLWPTPAQFELLISQSGQNLAATAVDPVSLSTPLLAFTSNSFRSNLVSDTIIGTIIGTGIGTANSDTLLVFSGEATELQQKENYYRHAVVRSLVDPEKTARILSYKYLGTDTAQATIDQPIHLAPADSFSICDPTDISLGLVFIPCGSNAEDAYVGKYLFNETVTEGRLITGYDSTTGLVAVQQPPALTGWSATDNFSIRKELPALSVAAGGASTTSSVVITGGSPIDGFYTGSFIRVPNVIYGNATTIAAEGETRRIIAYDGASMTATVSPPFSSSFPGFILEILSFSYDNFNPFVFSGSQEHEFVPYNIALKSLVVPNQTLKVGGGGQIAFYPYLYVELSPLEKPNNFITNSNNPNSRRALFRASIDDIQNLQSATFLTLKGDDMTQTHQFKVGTNFRFRVFLPNGELFQTSIGETFSPQEANPLVQISALFGLRRV